MRRPELKKVAAEHKIRVLILPKIFEVRWTESTFKLVRNTLVSWNALVIYFNRNENDAKCAGYLKYPTNINNLKLIALIGDILLVFSRLQKQLQSNTLTIISMKSYINATLRKFNDMKTAKIPGGFESNLTKQLVHEEIEEEDEHGNVKKVVKVFFKSIELDINKPSRRARESIDDLREHILTVLCDFLDKRFQTDEDFLEKIIPFVNFDPSTNVEQVHSLCAPDVSLPSLYMQFDDFSSGNAMKDLSVGEIISKLSKSDESRDTYKELIIVLARIAACTPHSSDVERMIQANNRLKTNIRNRKQISIDIYISTQTCPFYHNGIQQQQLKCLLMKKIVAIEIQIQNQFSVEFSPKRVGMKMNVMTMMMTATMMTTTRQTTLETQFLNFNLNSI